MAKKKNGKGSIFLRKDGRWEGRIVVGYADNGNPRTKNVLAKTKEECEESFRKFITKESLTVSFVGDVKQFKLKI